MREFRFGVRGKTFRGSRVFGLGIFSSIVGKQAQSASIRPAVTTKQPDHFQTKVQIYLEK